MLLSAHAARLSRSARSAARYAIPAIAAVLGAAGCLHAPDGVRALRASEVRAVEALRAEWVAAGRESAECVYIEPERMRIWVGPQDEVTSWCGRPADQPVLACGSVVNMHVFDIPGRAWLRISETPSPRVHHSLVIHETGHQLRGCVMRDVDYLHGDRELWYDIERAALERWEGGEDAGP